jgi:hypothetical protein
MIGYASLDGRKVESVRVAVSGLALRATGYIVSTQQPLYGASYSVVVDTEGRTRRITVRCDDVTGERSLSLTRSPGGPWIAESVAGSSPVPGLSAAVDAFIADSAFSASLPVRRLGLHTSVGTEADVVVASISLPDLTVSPIAHHGRSESVNAEGALIAYSGEYGERTVVVDSDGLYVSAEGLSKRVG